METMNREQPVSLRPGNLPTIIVTGASGFIGRHFLQEYKEDYFIYAIARRPQKLANVPEHSNIVWIQVDIAEQKMVERAFREIKLQGNIDFVLHLAGFYDFNNEPNPEYERTNVKGTENILKSATSLKIKRFIFASSLTVTEFTGKNILINEKSPCDAEFPYAETKCKAEKLVTEYSIYFPCSIVRLAAIFSDWCEYGPLYMFLSTWLSESWKSRIIAGKGKTSVPYLHVRDLNRCFTNIFQQTARLPGLDTYIASPDGSTSHRELYQATVKYFFREPRQPIFMPKLLSALGVWSLDFLGKIIGKRPFERPWMTRYIDKKLHIDAAYTRQQLGWHPVTRYHILRRLLFLLENLKSDPLTWQHRNEEALHKNLIERPNIKIYAAMLKIEPNLIEAATEMFSSFEHRQELSSYEKISLEELRRRVVVVFDMFKTAVRTGDRIHILKYSKELSVQRFIEGFNVKEVVTAVNLIADLILAKLSNLPEMKDLIPRIEDEISMINQLLIDEIEDSFERLTGFG
jgi:nucleoside-diphosphate-sugar epimerase